MTIKENGRCSLLMAAYYIFNCVILGYAAYYLGAVGFSSWGIGVTMSASCAAGGVLQAAAGRLADKDPRWYWKKQLVVYSSFALFISVLRLVLNGHTWDWISYSLLIVMTFLMMPMVNSSCFYYSDRGIKTDYGTARGIGSLAYAAVSFIIGRLIGTSGYRVLLICCMASAAFMLVTSVIMPAAEGEVTKPAPESSRGSKGFVGRYPVFIVMTVGITLALIFQNVTNTYMINIVRDVGGDAGSMGTALAIAAVAELPVLFLYSRTKGKVTAATLIPVACFFFVMRGIFYIAAPSVMVIYIVQLLQSVSFGLIVAAKATYAYEAVAIEDETTGQAVMSMTDAFGAVAGNLLGGILISGGGTGLMLSVCTGLAAAGTIVALIAAICGRKERV